MLSDPLGTSSLQSSPYAAPPLCGDPRAAKSKVAIPGKLSSDEYFSVLENFELHSSFLGPNCNACNYMGCSHPITNRKIMLLGDELLPPIVGAKADCLPVLRVCGGGFAQLKVALEAQVMHGCKPNKDMIMAVSLQLHLARVGNELFWIEFDEFNEWVTETFGCTVMPFLTPYPEGIPVKILVRFQQMLTELRARWLGDFLGGLRWQYALWGPFAELIKEHSVKEIRANVAPVVLKDKGNKVIECEQSVWAGFPGSFSIGLPSSIEKSFITKLLDAIVKASPPSLGICRPGSESLEMGFRGTDGSVFKPGHPTIYLFGTSILREAAPALQDLTDKREVNVVSSCAGGNITKAFEQHPVPVESHKDDTLVLHCLGNPSISLYKYEKVGDSFHPVKPSLLNDCGVDSVVEYLKDALTWVRRNFKGRVIVVGPMPRYLSRCCDLNDHHFENHPIFSSITEYYHMLNVFLAKHNELRSAHDFDFLSFHEIFSEPFDSTFLRDSVHLTEDRSNEYAGFLANILEWKPKKFKTLKAATSFLTWSEMTFDKFHSLKGSDYDPQAYLAALTTFLYNE